MQMRLVGVLVVTAGLVTACTGSSVTHSAGTGPATGPTGSRSPTALSTDTAHATAFCRSLARAATRIASAEASVYTSGGAQTLQALQRELRGLEAGAPANVRSALEELATGFATAQQVVAHPTAQNKARLAALQAKLAADARVVSTYVVQKCPAH
jgi:hypothetical protein